MIIRKIKKNGIVNGKRLLKRLVFAAIIIGSIKWISYLFQSHTITTNITEKDLGQEVIVQWRLDVDNNFPHYTHSIVDATKNTIGLKSASVNLNSYSGKVEVVGKVEKFLKLTPILEVTAIKLPESKLIIKNNSYFFVDDFFVLDFSTQPQLSASKSGAEILVLFDNQPVVSIERFPCSKVLRGKDCTALVEEYARNAKDNFYSLWWYQYFKHTEKTRVVFEGEYYGFIFKQIDDDMMLNLSNMISLVNKEFVFKHRIDEVWKMCSSDIDPMNKILESDMKYSLNGMLTLHIRGETKWKNTTDCSIAFDPRNQWSVKKISAIK